MSQGFCCQRPKTGRRVIQPDWANLGQGAAPPTLDLATLPWFDLTVSNQPGIRYGAYQFVHMLDGQSFPNSPTIVVSQGQTVELRFVNDTDEYHPMHLHGHYFSVISNNGRPLTGSPIHLDSVLVGPRETWVVAFVADNPGLWMLHCHVLIHAAYGLSAMVSYTGISTPFTIGSLSGDFPE